MQLIQQQPELLKFFQDKAKSKLAWHDEHKKFLEETKFEANQRIYHDPNLVPKDAGRITAKSLERKFEKQINKVVAVSERRFSTKPVQEVQKVPSLLQLLQDKPETKLKSPENHRKSPLIHRKSTENIRRSIGQENTVLLTELEHKVLQPGHEIPHHKKRKNDAIRHFADPITNEPGIEDSIIQWNKRVILAEKNAEVLASKSHATGVISFMDFKRNQMSNDKKMTLSASEVLEKKLRAAELDPNRHFYEVFSGGSALYEKAYKTTVKQLESRSRSSSRATLSEFRIESTRLQSRDGPSNLEKARKTYSMMSLTSLSWKRAGITSRQQDTSTQTPVVGLISALRTPLDSTRREGPEDDKVAKEKQQQQQALGTRNPSLAQVLDDDDDSLFDDDVNPLEGPGPHPKKTQLTYPELPRTKSAAGKLQRVTYSLPVSRGDSGPTTPRLQFRKAEKAPQDKRKMRIKLTVSDPEKGFMELTNTTIVRKGHYQPPPPTNWKKRDLSGSGKVSSGKKKLTTEPNSARESTKADQSSPRELSTKESEVFEKKLRKTKHNMFRFHHKPFG